MTCPYKRFVSAGFLVAGLLISVSATAEDSRVSVLMLGDSGFHKPSEFYRHVTEPLAEQSIELRYTEDLGDINPENLAKYDGLMIFANVERITPEAESALLGFVEQGEPLTTVRSPVSGCKKYAPPPVSPVNSADFSMASFRRHLHLADARHRQVN